MLDSKATHSAQFIHHTVNEFYTYLRQLLDDYSLQVPKRTNSTHMHTQWTMLAIVLCSTYTTICSWLHRLLFFRCCCCCSLNFPETAVKCVSGLNIFRAMNERAHALVLISSAFFQKTFLNYSDYRLNSHLIESEIVQGNLLQIFFEYTFERVELCSIVWF